MMADRERRGESVQDELIESRQPPTIERVVVTSPLSIHLVDVVVPNLVRDHHGPTCTITDFGAGTGDRLRYLAQNLVSRVQDKQFEFVAYDPSPRPANGDKIEHRLARTQGRQPIEVQTEFPEKGDIVLANYSLHHMDDPARVVREEIGQRLRPDFLVISEFDFSTLPTDDPARALEEFRRRFAPLGGATKSPGMREAEEFIRAARLDPATANRAEEFGWQACFDYHRRYSQNDMIAMVEAAGYTTRQIAQPVKPFDRLIDETNQYILVAERVTKLTDMPQRD